jgi:hypothetical protein
MAFVRVDLADRDSRLYVRLKLPFEVASEGCAAVVVRIPLILEKGQCPCSFRLIFRPGYLPASGPASRVAWSGSANRCVVI